MKTVLVTKEGYRQGGFSRGLLCLLLALDSVVRRKRVGGVPARVVITAGSNGRHSKKGPHYAPRFEGLDVRTKDWPVTKIKKISFMMTVLEELDNENVRFGLNRRGWPCAFSAHYYGVLEHYGLESEHLHFQVAKNQTIGVA